MKGLLTTVCIFGIISTVQSFFPNDLYYHHHPDALLKLKKNYGKVRNSQRYRLHYRRGLDSIYNSDGSIKWPAPNQFNDGGYYPPRKYVSRPYREDYYPDDYYYYHGRPKKYYYDDDDRNHRPHHYNSHYYDEEDDDDDYRYYRKEEALPFAYESLVESNKAKGLPFAYESLATSNKDKNLPFAYESLATSNKEENLPFAYESLATSNKEENLPFAYESLATSNKEENLPFAYESLVKTNNNETNLQNTTTTTTIITDDSESDETRILDGHLQLSGIPLKDGYTFGMGTYYDLETHVGSCGKQNKNTELVAALSSEQMGDGGHNNPNCGKEIQVIGPNKTSVQVKVVSDCKTCKSGGLDLSPAAYEQLGNFSHLSIPIKWKFVE